MKRFLTAVVVCMVLLSPWESIHAQEADTASPTASSNVFCTDNFALTKIEIGVTSNLAEAVPQSPIEFTGVIKNQNNITVPAAELRARVFRISEGQVPAFVDSYTVAENIVLPATGEYAFTDEWIVPTNQPAGEYEVEYAISFTGGAAAVIGSSPRFTIASEEQSVQFVYDTLQINGEPYQTFDQTTIADDQSVIVSITITNPTSEEKLVPMQWNQYQGSSPVEGNRLDTKTSLLSIEANSEEVVTYTTKPTNAKQVLVDAIIDDRGVKSMFDFELVRATPDPEIVVAGISTTPLIANQATELFSCIKTPSNTDIRTYSMMFEVLDTMDVVVASLTQGDVSQVQVPSIVSATTLNSATLRASLNNEGVPIAVVEQVYDCTLLNNEGCFIELAIEKPLLDLLTNPVFLTLILGVILLILCLYMYMKKRKQKANHIIAAVLPYIGFGVLALASASLLAVTPVEAKSVTWSERTGHPQFFAWAGVNQYDSFNIENSVTYSATVRNLTKGNSVVTDGSTVAVGDELEVTITPLQNSDIRWSPGGTGTYFDNIYNPGVPRNGYTSISPTSPSEACVLSNISVISTTLGGSSIPGFNFGGGNNLVPIGSVIFTSGIANSMTTTAVTPPSTSVSGTGLSCSGTRCTVTGGGTLSLNVTFAETDLAMYQYSAQPSGSGFTCTENSGIPWWPSPKMLTIPQQTISFSLNSSAATPPPSNAGSCTIDISSSEAQRAINECRSVPGFSGQVQYVLNNGGQYTVCHNQELEEPQACSGGHQVAWQGHPLCAGNFPACTVPPTGGACNASICSLVTPQERDLTIAQRIEDCQVGTTAEIGPLNCDYGNHFKHWCENLPNNCTPPTTPPPSADICTMKREVVSGASPSCAEMGWAGERVALSVNQSMTTWRLQAPEGECVTTNQNGTMMLERLVAVDCQGVVTTNDLTINGSDGPLTVSDTDTLNLNWNSTNAGNCTLYGAGLSGGGVPLTGTASVPASAITNPSETYVLNCDGAVDSVLVNVTDTNAPPNPPTIVGPVNGDTGISHQFTFTATDPNNDQLQYEVDWDNNGTSEVTSLLVNSGISITGNRSWFTAGSYTFQVRARDTAGATSAWTQHTITLVQSSPATALIEVQVNGGSWSANDQTIDPGDSINIRWSSTGATNCVGTNFNTGGAISGTTGASAPSPNSATDFSISCNGTGGPGNDSIRITTRNLPNFNQPSVTYNLSAEYDPVTGIYDSVTVIFQTLNDGGSPTKVDADYRVRFDRGTDGYDQTEAGSLGLLSVGQGVNRTEVFNNVAFSGNRVEVTVDSGNAVAEINEDDNVRVLDMVIPPPNPNLEITASRPVVSAGDSVTLSWNTRASYPMNCTVLGPGVGPINFNPSVAGPTGTAPSQPIMAKSEFTLRCVEPVTNTTFVDTVTVEVVGTLEEI